MRTTGTLCVRSEFSYGSEQQQMGFITSSQSLNLGVRRGIIDDVATWVSYVFCLLVGPPGFNCRFSFAPVFQWCCSTPQGSPGIGRNTLFLSIYLFPVMIH